MLTVVVVVVVGLLLLLLLLLMLTTLIGTLPRGAQSITTPDDEGDRRR
jgi:hypothetical protein